MPHDDAIKAEFVKVSTGYNIGSLKVSAELLRQALHLPDDVQIVDAVFDRRREIVDLVVAGPKMPPLLFGHPISEVLAIYSVSYNNKELVPEKTVTVRFEPVA